MKTKNEIKKKIEFLASDERLGYPPASIQVNAPLALIQVELEARISSLQWVLSGDEDEENED